MGALMPKLDNFQVYLYIFDLETNSGGKGFGEGTGGHWFIPGYLWNLTLSEKSGFHNPGLSWAV